MCFSEAMDVVKGKVGAVEGQRDKNSWKRFLEISRKMLVVHKIVLSRDVR